MLSERKGVAVFAAGLGVLMAWTAWLEECMLDLRFEKVLGLVWRIEETVAISSQRRMRTWFEVEQGGHG